MYPGSEDPFAVKLFINDQDFFVLPCFKRKLTKGIVTKYECGPGGLYAGPLGFEGKMNQSHIESLKNALNSELSDYSFRINPFLISEEIQESDSNLFTQLVDYADQENRVSILQQSGVAYDARLAQKKGLRVTLAENGDLKSFLEVYNAIRSSWESPGTYYPAEFFDNLIASTYCDFWSVYQHEEYIGGGIILKGPKHVSSWLTIIHPNHRKYRPYEFVYTQLIDHYMASGFSYFDFNPSAGLEGVVKFKEKFGTVRIPFLEFENQSPTSALISSIRGIIS